MSEELSKKYRVAASMTYSGVFYLEAESDEAAEAAAKELVFDYLSECGSETDTFLTEVGGYPPDAEFWTGGTHGFWDLTPHPEPPS